MGNGEWRRVASRGHQLADSFLCLANKNKEGIVLHYHLLGLVSSQELTWASAAPATILMEKVCASFANGQWRVARHPGAQQCEQLFPVQGFGPDGNGD